MSVLSIASVVSRRLAASLVLGAVAASPVFAAGPVLRAQDVTESALIDALSIDSPQDTGGIKRGFKPAAPGAVNSSGTSKAAGPGRASLLITFETNSSSLTPEAMSVLDTVANALQSDALEGFTFRVEGHADVRGDADANMTLSQQRAEAVVNYLVSKHGVLPERLVPVGKGSSEPLNKARADAPENRRVTIVTTRS